MKQRR